MRCAGDRPDGLRMRGLIIVLWRAGLRISEALALAESDLDRAGAILVRHGKRGKRREVGIDPWAWEQLAPWLRLRATLPVGALFLHHPRPNIRTPLVSTRRARTASPDRGARRCTPALRSPPAAPRPRRRDGTRRRAAHGPQRQLGHANLGITSVYLQGIDNAEIIDTVHASRAPMIPPAPAAAAVHRHDVGASSRVTLLLLVPCGRLGLNDQHARSRARAKARFGNAHALMSLLGVVRLRTGHESGQDAVRSSAGTPCLCWARLWRPSVPPPRSSSCASSCCLGGSARSRYSSS